MFMDINPRIFSSSASNKSSRAKCSTSNQLQIEPTCISTSSTRKNHRETQTFMRGIATHTRSKRPFFEWKWTKTMFGRRWLCIQATGSLPSKTEGSHDVAYREDASNRTRPSSTRLEDRGKIVAKVSWSFVRFVVESAPKKSPSKR